MNSPHLATSSSTHDRQRNDPVTPLTTRSLNSLFERAATEAFESLIVGRFGLLTVQGRIADLPSGRYTTIYDVPLEDDGVISYLQVPRRLAEERELSVGDYVRVTGSLMVNTKLSGQIKMRLNVCQLQLIDSPQEVERKRSERTAIDRVRELRRKRDGFPFKERVVISVICAHESQVLEDFKGALSRVAGVVEINPIHVAMDSPADIAIALEEASADIVVLIRGGGSGEMFTVLEDSRVIEALGAKAAFRIVGLGHSTHVGIADLVADYAASTPTDAGSFITRQLEAFATLKDEASKAFSRERDERMRVAQAIRKQDQDMGATSAELGDLRRRLVNQSSRERIYKKTIGALGVAVVAALAIIFMRH